MFAEGKDIIAKEDSDAIRLPNAVNRPKTLTLTNDPDMPTQQMVMSPTAFLSGQPGSP
jgi:hypothetical protein